MMHMTFYWGTEVTLLFTSWKTTTLFPYLLTLLSCFLVSTFYQYMEDFRLRLSTYVSFPSTEASNPSSVNAPLLLSLPGKSGGRLWAFKALKGAVFGFNAAIGYLLMLAIMSFNGGVFIAVVFGLAFGFVLFRSGDDDGSNNKASGVDNPCACV